MLRVAFGFLLLLTVSCAGASAPVAPSPSGPQSTTVAPEANSTDASDLSATVAPPLGGSPGDGSGPPTREPGPSTSPETGPPARASVSPGEQSPVATPTAAPRVLETGPAVESPQDPTETTTETTSAVKAGPTIAPTPALEATPHASPTPGSETTSDPNVSQDGAGPQPMHFTLPSADGRVVESESYLAQKNIVLVFYRAFW